MNNRIEIRPGRTIHLCIHQNSASDKTAFLIHGLGGRGEQWRFQIDMLKEKYTLIIPDLPGNGKSDKPKPDKTNPYSFIEFHQDLQTLFNKYATNDNVVIGHSYGGALATSLTINNQNTIRQLVLLGPTACSPNVDIPMFYRLPEFVMALFRPIIEKQFQKSAFDPSTNPALIAEEMHALKSNPIYVISAMVAGMKDVVKVDVTSITIPVLMLTGQHDKLIPPVISTEFYKGLPHKQFETIKNAAHLMHLEKAAEVNELIRNFLNHNPG